jgi:hypothetical protein
LDTTAIPGIGTTTAQVITAETGADMTRFPTAGHLASWAGVCPGHHESAGRTKSTHTRPGNPYLKAVLGTAAMNAARNKESYLGARYRRLAARRRKGKAVVAIQHTILVAIWHMAQTGALYDDLAADYYTRIQPIRTKRRAIRQLQRTRLHRDPPARQLSCHSGNLRVDVPAVRGVDRLEGGEGVYPEDLEAAESMAGFRVGVGDALLVRTGFGDGVGRPIAAEDGMPGCRPVACRGFASAVSLL